MNLKLTWSPSSDTRTFTIAAFERPFRRLATWKIDTSSLLAVD